MSLSLYADGNHVAQVGTAQGWFDFTTWIMDNTHEDSMLFALASDGEACDANEIADDLRALLDSNPPDSDTVRSTAEDLIASLSGVPEDAVLQVSDE